MSPVTVLFPKTTVIILVDIIEKVIENNAKASINCDLDRVLNRPVSGLFFSNSTLEHATQLYNQHHTRAVSTKGGYYK